MGKDSWDLSNAMAREYAVPLVDKRLAARLAKLGAVVVTGFAKTG